MRGMKNLEESVMPFSVGNATVGMVANLHMMSRFAFLLYPDSSSSPCIIFTSGTVFSSSSLTSFYGALMEVQQLDLTSASSRRKT